MIILRERAINTVDNHMTMFFSYLSLLGHTATAVTHALQGTEINLS